MPDQKHGGESYNPPTPQELKDIITNPAAAETLVKTAESLGEALAKPLTTSQIRAIYGEVLQIKADWLSPESKTDPGALSRKDRAKRAFILLKPKMAYRARKEKGQGVKMLVNVLDPAVDLVKGDDDNFRRFVEFFEAILAYHKAKGGN